MGEREALWVGDGDEQLVAAAKRDPEAFVALYRRYAPTVYGYCYNRLGSREQAEDATSQVFLKALAAMPRYREDAPSFRAWLFTIAHNLCAYPGAWGPSSAFVAGRPRAAWS